MDSQTDPAAASLPRPFGRFVLVAPVGRGGMGVVYRAEQPELGRTVALKLLRADSVDDAPLRQRFEREARAAARLSHPGIAAVHEVGAIDGRPYFAMDWIDGGDLEHVAAAGPLPARRAAEILRDTARAIAHAHAAGVVHRDLKPGNILVDRAGRAVVTDFGLAREVNADATRLTATGEIVGTPAYMAPEQARGAQAEIGPRSDVYALGAVLYFLLTGRAPFAGDSAIEILAQVLAVDPPAPRRLNPRVHRDLETICRVAMHKDPAHRYATAADLADDCERFLRGEPIRARAPGLVSLLGRRLAQCRGLVAAVAAAALLLAASAGVLLPQLRQRQEELARRAERKPLEDAILAARPLYYVEGPDLEAKLSEVEQALQKLTKIAADPDRAGDPALWTTLGLGWYFIGDAAQAEQALLHARALAPDDVNVTYHLGRIYVERTSEVQLEYQHESAGQSRERLAAVRRQASDCLGHALAGAGALPEIDRAVAAGYRALAEERYADLLRICTDGVKRFGDAVGVEEFWNLLGLHRQRSDRLDCYSRALARRPNYAWGLFMRATLRANSDDLMGARVDLDRAIRVNPRFACGHYLRGVVRLDLRDFDGALDDFEATLRLTPTSVPALNNRGFLRLRSRAWAQAAADFEEALRLDPRYAPARQNLATLRVRQGDPAGARREIDEALRLDPDNPATLACRGGLRADAGDREGARADLDRAISLGAKSPLPFYHRANLRRDSGDTAGALADYGEAIARSPYDVEALNNRGSLRLRLGDAKGALADLDAALRLDPAYVKAFINRGSARIALGDLAGGVADASAALHLDPESLEARLNRAAARRRQGDLDGALADLDQAARIAPRDATPHQLRGALLMTRGDVDGAIAEFEAALRLDPHLALAATNAGSARLAKGDFAGARAAFEAALAIDARSAEAWFGRGYVRQEGGDLDGAIADYSEAVRLEPRRADAWLNRGNAWYVKKDVARALADYEEALRVAPATWPQRAAAQGLVRKLRQKR